MGRIFVTPQPAKAFTPPLTLRTIKHPQGKDVRTRRMSVERGSWLLCWMGEEGSDVCGRPDQGDARGPHAKHAD